jgi:predicted RNA-binding Zn-ribbon protein involved in translation (DUF1610 family)
MVVEPCPRCGEATMRAPLASNALSRTTRAEGDTPVYVCSSCGVEEAIQEFVAIKEFAEGHHGATPRKEWPIT